MEKLLSTNKLKCLSVNPEAYVKRKKSGKYVLYPNNREKSRIKAGSAQACWKKYFADIVDTDTVR